jgi:beta-phosphoglucomutase-like phosphatase (HAD superfamily)
MDIRQTEAMCRQNNLTIHQMGIVPHDVERHKYAMSLFEKLNRKESELIQRENSYYALQEEMKKRKKTIRTMKNAVEDLRFELGKMGY